MHKRHSQVKNTPASVPIPKFASLCGTLECELRNQRNTRQCGRIEPSIDRGDSRIRISVIHGWPVNGRPAMLTRMTEADWALVVQLFREARSRRGDKGRDDRNFLEALQYFVVHNITWRALPPKFGPWNSIWK